MESETRVAAREAPLRLFGPHPGGGDACAEGSEPVRALPAAAELKSGSEVGSVAAEAQSALFAFRAEMSQVEINGRAPGEWQRQRAAEDGAIAERALVFAQMRGAKQVEGLDVARLRGGADTQNEEQKRRGGADGVQRQSRLCGLKALRCFGCGGP